jgi:hypothetical protein
MGYEAGVIKSSPGRDGVVETSVERGTGVTSESGLSYTETRSQTEWGNSAVTG